MLKLAGDPLMAPILKNAGKDISHWFDKRTGDVSNTLGLKSSLITSNRVANAMNI
jgi:hypothetical protein